MIIRQKEFGNKANKVAKKGWEKIIARYNNGGDIGRFRKINRAVIHETYPGSGDYLVSDVMDSINLRSSFRYPKVRQTKSALRPQIKDKKSIMKEARQNHDLLKSLFKD